MIWLSCRSVLMKHEAVWSPGDHLDGPAVDAVSFQPGAIFGEIFADVPTRSGCRPGDRD